MEHSLYQESDNLQLNSLQKIFFDSLKNVFQSFNLSYEKLKKEKDETLKNLKTELKIIEGDNNVYF